MIIKFPETFVFLFQKCLSTSFHTSYLSFFFTQAKFLENKIYTEKTGKLRQNTQKIANFLCYYGKIHSKLPIFRVKSVKIYTGQKKFTRASLVGSWQIWGMITSTFCILSKLLLPSWDLGLSQRLFQFLTLIWGFRGSRWIDMSWASFMAATTWRNIDLKNSFKQ